MEEIYRSSVPVGLLLAEYGPLSAIVRKDASGERQFIVAGYASPQVVDRERHLITREAMAEDLPRFMAHPRYRNVNIVHSNITVGEVLPLWVDPETGEEWTTHVDDIGLFCVVRLRTDKYRPQICERVEEDILNGKLNSFSISGDAPFESRQYQCADGQCFWVISKIEFYEITVGVVENALIRVRGGDKPIQEIRVGDEVITHRRRLRPITGVAKTAYCGTIKRLTLDDGRILEVTPEHKVRVRNRGWIRADQLREGDELYNGVPNRAGKSGDAWRETVLARYGSYKDIPNRSGGIKTAEGRARQVADVTSASFRKQCAEIMKMKWADPHYRAAALVTLAESMEKRRKRSDQARENISRNLAKLRQDPAFNEKMFRSMRLSPNKVEKALWEKLGPHGFLFTGDGKLVTRSGLVPDFRHRSGKVVVELFGDYWHRGEDPEHRIARLKQDGYTCIVLWERDFKRDPDACVARVLEAINA